MTLKSRLALVLFVLLAAPLMAADQWIPGELLVKFATGTDPDEVLQVNVALQARIGSTFRGDGDLYKVVLPPGTNLDDAIARYEQFANVVWAEKNYILRTVVIPNDLRFNELWGMHNTGQTGGTPDADVDAPEAWDKFTGNGTIVVADIDTGVDYNHEDLLGNIWLNVDEIPANGIDDDANGFIDDTRGWDFVSNDNNPMDDNDHGTHTSGTFGAMGNNLLGVAGANWDLQIMPVKFLNASGSGSTENAIKALDYATENGARLSNNSWGGGGFSQGLMDAIERANAAGSLFVAAAGNSNNNNDLFPFYPCVYSNVNVMCIASTTHTDAKSSFSSYGATTVDLAAPGSSILSTTPGNTYQVFSGTSMATPHVAGGVALVWGCNSVLGHLTVKQIVMDTVRPVPSMSGITVTGGVVNYFNALNDSRVGSCGAPPPPGENQPPSADPNGPYTGVWKKPVQFDGSGSTDPDGTIVSYTWNFGDGTFGSGPTPTHTYARGGTYTITLTVQDNQGATDSGSTTANIKGKKN